ncbi:MAG: hypothetical protein R3B09_15355 [Nannocystaceae bacterium]
MRYDHPSSPIAFSLLALALAAPACSGDDSASTTETGSTSTTGSTSGSTSDTSTTADTSTSTSTSTTETTSASATETDTGSETTGAPASKGTAWYFGADPDNNRWTITIVDPTDPALVVAEIEVSDLADLSGPSGNSAGPNWSDGLPSTDQSRVFVNARSVDKVAVFETATFTLEAILDVGASPVHIFNPNLGGEIWTHADTPGSFYVIDQTSLAVSDPVVASAMGGHGKLLYAEQLGMKYYATEVNDPGVYAIDGATKTVGPLIPLCGQPCMDDPNTPEDESQNTCGGTHYKAYDPTMNLAIFQCSGDTSGHYAFVDASDDSVVADLVPMSGSVAFSHGWGYTLLIDADAGVQIWDAGAPGHDGMQFDGVVDVPGGPNATGTDFRMRGDGTWEAWLPENTGTKVAVVDLSTYALAEEIEIGVLSPPMGSTSVSRRGIIGGQWFFTYNDAGIVFVDLNTHEVTQGPAPAAPIQRVTFAGSGS